MSDSVSIINYKDTLYFSTISHGYFCEYRLPGHGLMWVRSGHMEIESKEGKVTAGAGRFIFWQRDCCSSMRKLTDGDTPFRSVALTLPRAFLKEYFQHHVIAARQQKNPGEIGGRAVLLPDTIELDSLFYSLLPYAEKGVEPGEKIIKAKVFEAISILLKIDDRFYPTLFDFHETWKIDLYDFMKAYYMEDMSIEDFAHYSGRSLATFKRDFAKISDETPQKWIIRERLNLAAKLMAEEGVKPTDVCFRTGFRSKAHFHRAFKERFGCTPLEYKETKKE